MKIPKRVNLGFGYTVQVRYCTRTEMTDRAAAEAMGKVPDGYWDSDTREIWIVQDDLSIAHQRYVYAHEMHHAIVDFMDEYLDTWSISERSRPAHKPTHLVPVSGVGVTALLAVKGAPVDPHRPECAGDKQDG